MLEGLGIVIPIIIAVIIYSVRVETRITKIQNDICWIKKEMKRCRQP